MRKIREMGIAKVDIDVMNLPQKKRKKNKKLDS